MADGKDIPIRITTSADTKGAEAAEEAIDKVKESADQATASTRGFEGQLESSGAGAVREWDEATKAAAESTREAGQAAADAAESVEALGDAAEEAGDQAGDMEENVDKIASIQKAQAIAAVGEKVADLGRKFKDVADEVQDLDPEAARTLRNIGNGLDSVGSKAATVAIGFAAGGPIGAALAALGTLVIEVANLFTQQEIAVLRAAAAERKAIEEVTDATREAALAAKERAEALAAGAENAGLEREVAAARQYTSELQRQLEIIREKRRLENEVLDARDQADLAGVDYDEATGKLTPAQAAEKRAGIEAEARRRGREERKRQAQEDRTAAAADALAQTQAAEAAAKRAEELARKRDEAEKAARGLADYAEGETKKITPDKDGNLSESDRAFMAQIEDEIASAREVAKTLREEAAKAEAAAKAAADAAATARRDATDKGRRADDITRTVDAVQAADDERVSTQGRTAAQRGLAEARRRQAEEQARAEEERKRQQEQRDRAAAGAGRDASKLVPDDVKASFRDAVNNVVAGLQNGDQGGEIRELVSLLQRLATAMQAQGRDVAQLKQTIANLQGQIKTSRDGR